jgi:hypothetical protein
MALAKLEFGKSNVLLSGENSGASNLADPETIEYASPDRAGVSDGAAAESEPEASEPAADLAVDKTPKPKLPKADLPTGDEEGGEPESEYAIDPHSSPTAEGAAQEPAAAAADDFSPAILERAKQYGFDETSAKRFGSPDNLEWAMAERDRLASEWGQQQIAALQYQQSQQFHPPAQSGAASPQPAIPQPAPAASQQPGIINKFVVPKEELAKQGFDEDTISFLDKMAGHFNGQLETLASQHIAPIQQKVDETLNQFTGQSQAEAQAQFAREVDGYIAKLGPEWEAEFGKGDVYAQVPNTPTHTTRVKLAQTAIGLMAAEAQSQPSQRSTMTELLEKAHNALHFQKKQDLARKALADKAGERRSQTIARAGHHRGQPMTGVEKAIRRANTFAKKLPVA